MVYRLQMALLRWINRVRRMSGVMARHLMIYDPRPDWRTVRVGDKDVSMKVEDFKLLLSEVIDGMVWVWL